MPPHTPNASLLIVLQKTIPAALGLTRCDRRFLLRIRLGPNCVIAASDPSQLFRRLLSSTLSPTLPLTSVPSKPTLLLNRRLLGLLGFCLFTYPLTLRFTESPLGTVHESAEGLAHPSQEHDNGQQDQQSSEPFQVRRRLREASVDRLLYDRQREIERQQ